MEIFKLPPVIAGLVLARDELRRHYREVLDKSGSAVDLLFTFDGNLVGDLGEAIAVELYGIKLVETKSSEGIDGYAPDGVSTVQVKATGTGRGPAFRRTEMRADHLLFFGLNFARAEGFVIYNGPEHYAVSMLPADFRGQRSLTPLQIRSADKMVKPHERLPRVSF